MFGKHFHVAGKSPFMFKKLKKGNIFLSKRNLVCTQYISIFAVTLRINEKAVALHISRYFDTICEIQIHSSLKKFVDLKRTKTVG